MIYKINRIQQKSILFPNHKRQNFLNRPWNKTKNREENHRWEKVIKDEFQNAIEIRQR